MRGVLLILALTLGSCSNESSFDERYDAAEKSIRDKAAKIDAELAESERQAAEISTAATPRPR